MIVLIISSIFTFQLLNKGCHSFTLKHALTKHISKIPFSPTNHYKTTLLRSNNNDDHEAVVLTERKLYRLNPSASSFMNLNSSGTYFQIEEQIGFYEQEDELVPGTRTIIIRGKPDEDVVAPPVSSDSNKPRRRMVRVGAEIFRFSFEESTPTVSDDDTQDDSTYTGQAIGGSAWEASIAMSLFFASRPELLFGDVLELGSGIGLGGILSTISALQSSNTDMNMESLTLTDSYELLLQTCIQNIQLANLNSSVQKCDVQQLDWYNKIPQDMQQQYQTILAADCAYLYPDIKPLARTIAYLLSSQKQQGKVFIFGPYQRSALRDVQTELEGQYRMDVTLALMEMEVIELEPINTESSSHEEDEEGEVSFLPLTSKKLKEFLLVEAEHNEMFTGIGDGEDFFLPDDYDDLDNERLDLEPELERKPW